METEITSENTARGLRPWKPGESGNPKGRGKGRVNLTTAIKRILLEVDPNDPERRTRADELARAIIDLAAKGNGPAIREVFARIDGPIPTVVESGPKELQLLRVIGLTATTETVKAAKTFLKTISENDPTEVLKNANAQELRVVVTYVDDPPPIDNGLGFDRDGPGNDECADFCGKAP